MNRGMKIAMISVLMAVFGLPIVLGDFCTIRGQISYSDGTPVEDNTTVFIHYEYFNFSYETWTGGAWPYPNYYFYMFTCRQGEDSVRLEVLGETQKVTLDRGVIDYDMRLSIKPAEKPPIEVTERQEAVKKSGGGGTTTTVGYGETETIISPGNDLVLIYNEDWIDLSKYIFKVERLGDTFIRVRLYPGERQLVFYTGEETEVDLDGDLEPDILLTLDKIEKGFAFVTLRKIMREPRPAPEEESPGRFETQQDNVINMKPINFMSLMDPRVINIILVGLITVLIIMLVRGRRRNEA